MNVDFDATCPQARRVFALVRRITLVIAWATTLTSCALDVDRLRVDARRDASLDATAADAEAGRDASPPSADLGEPDAGACACASAGFSTEIEIEGTGVLSVAAADVDGDGDDDVLADVGTGLVALQMDRRGCAAGELVGDAAMFDLLAPGTRFALVDWSNDDVPDVVAPRPDTDVVQLLRGNVSEGNYRLTTSSALIVPVPAGCRVAVPVQVAMTGSGDHAAIVLCDGVGGEFVRFDGGGTARTERFSTAGGALDAAFEPYYDGTRHGVIAHGSMGIELVELRPPSTIATITTLMPIDGNDIARVLMADLDGDASLDVIGLDVTNGKLQIHRGLDPGTFSPPIEVAASGALAMALAHLDGDTTPEIVVLARDTLRFFEWDGIALTSSSTVASSDLTSVVVGDVDGDRRDDLIVGRNRFGLSSVVLYTQICR